MNNSPKNKYLFSTLIVLSTTLSSCQSLFRPDERHPDFKKANELLNDSNTTEQLSRQKILEANEQNKQLKKIHQTARKENWSPEKTKTKITDMNQQVRASRQKGAKLRKKAAEQKNQALQYYRNGMRQLWKNWILEPGVMTLKNTPRISLAHNTPVRSADPKALARQAESNSRKNDLTESLITNRLIALEEQNAPKDLDLSSFQLSHQQKYIAHIEAGDAKNKFPLQVPLNEIHTWRLIVSDIYGRPVDSKIGVTGHMPGHVHGLPTQPEVTKKLAPGVYLVDGLKFQMQGWWVMKFIFENGDSIKFNLAL